MGLMSKFIRKRNKLQTPEVSKDGWISSNFFLPEHLSSIGRTIVYSPSQRYAMLRGNPDGDDYKNNRVIIIDLVKRRLIASIKNKFKFVYWYWLNENTICLLTEDFKETGTKYTKYIYKCNLNKQYWNIKLLTTSLITHTEFEFTINGLYSNDSCRMTIHGHDFLVLKTYKIVLLPYNVMTMGPHLPPLIFSETINDGIHDRYGVTSDCSFTYKSWMYFCLYDSHQRCHIFDRFLRIEATDFDLNEGKVVLNRDPGDIVLFAPRKQNQGSYQPVGYQGEQKFALWQNDSSVIFYYTSWKGNSNVWIYDLEKETLFEKKIEGLRFHWATLNRDYLLLWLHKEKDWDPTEILYKFQWIGHKTPRLSDICAVKLMNKATVDPIFSKKYNVFLNV